MERVEAKVNRDPKIVRAFVEALERAPLIPLAVTGVAAAEMVFNPPPIYAQSQQDGCTVNIEVYRADYEKNSVLTDKATLPISCSEEKMIAVNPARSGSIRYDSVLNYVGVGALTFSIGLLCGAALGRAGEN